MKAKCPHCGCGCNRCVDGYIDVGITVRSWSPPVHQEVQPVRIRSRGRVHWAKFTTAED